jgi:hypothetical protein
MITDQRGHTQEKLFSLSIFISQEVYFVYIHKLHHFHHQLLPNIVIEWLTLLLHIREVPGLILGPGDRLSWVTFRGFPQSFQENAGTE